MFKREKTFEFSELGWEMSHMSYFQREILNNKWIVKGFSYGLVGLITLNNILHKKGLMNMAMWNAIVKIRYIFFFMGLLLLTLNFCKTLINVKNNGRSIKDNILIVLCSVFAPSIQEEFETIVIDKELPNNILQTFKVQ